jgi:hypothetical protein
LAASTTLPVSKNGLFEPFYTKNASFYQDRLGTNIGKTQKETVSSLGSNGYKNLLITPPSELIRAAMSASTAAAIATSKTSNSPPLLLAAHDRGVSASSKAAAAARTGSSSPPLTWSSATKDTPQGEAALFWRVGVRNRLSFWSTFSSIQN